MQCGGGCRGQSALAFSHTLAWRYERPLAHVCTPLVSFSVCSLPAALLAVIHHGCLSHEAFLQLDIILLSSAQSSSFAHGFVSQVTAKFVGNGSFRAAVLYRYISWWSPCGSVASYVTRSFLMDSILTVVREWQGVGRTEAGRGENERGETKRTGKATDSRRKGWDVTQKRNERVRTRGKNTTEISPSRAVLSGTGNPGRQSTTNYRRCIVVTISHYSMSVPGDDTSQSSLLCSCTDLTEWFSFRL